MAINLQTFRDLVRKQAGGPGVCEIDNDCIDDKINEALEAYSRLNPIRVVEPVTFNANDPNADFPNLCFGIDHQVHIEEGSGAAIGYGGYGSQNLAGFGYQHYGIGGLQSSIPAITGVRMVQHMGETLDQTFPSMEFFERGGKVNVSPPPSTQTVLHVPLLKKHELANFPVQDEWILRDLAAAFVLKFRALKYKFESVSAANGRRKITFGKVRDFYNKEGDARIEKIARHFGVSPASIG